MKQVATAILLLVLLLLTACPKKTVKDLKGTDAEMAERAKVLRMAIIAYHSETAEYPRELRAVEPYLQPGTSWPVNPYNNQPIEDSGSADFDPGKSVGTVYYEKYIRNDTEQIAGYRLHVFGDKGLLMIFDNSAFGVQ